MIYDERRVTLQFMQDNKIDVFISDAEIEYFELSKSISDQTWDEFVIASYRGKYACPYSKISKGRMCGGRSAYSQPGGHSPLCYLKDVYRKYPSLKSAGVAADLFNY